MVSRKTPSDRKNYDHYKIKTFSRILPETRTYVKSYTGQTKWMYFLIKEDELLMKYNDIRNKVNNSIKKEFHRKPIYNKTLKKTKS